MAMIWAVYDAREYSWWGLSNDDRQRFKDWVREQGVPSDGRSTYRFEIHGFERLFLRVFEFKLDEQGQKSIDPVTNDVARHAPCDWPITSMPPVCPFPHNRTPNRHAE